MISFSSPQLGIAAIAAAIVAMGIAIVRRVNIPILSRFLLGAGVLLLALAAGGPVWNRAQRETIAVMVDLSPSTRGAKFRNADFLRRRLRELIGNSHYQLIAFAGQNLLIDPSDPLAEMPTDQTRFTPAPADAIVLFSDAQFDLPSASPPIYIVADEGLENISDASVQQLELRGGELSATLANAGARRAVSFEGTTGAATAPVYPGTTVIDRPISGAGVAGAKLNPGDLWPENDSLWLRVAAPTAGEKWWIGENSPRGDWKSLQPQRVSNLPQDYLAPAVIVVENQPADRFTPSQMDCLMQYVRDLGGSLLIVGGDHAFAAGEYDGSRFEELSPLASSPPTPTTRWILLVDGSGSMSQDAGGGISRWQTAARAVIHLLPNLPSADPVEIGQFSDTVRWWLQASTAAEAARTPLPPADAFAHGPTNLELALNQIAGDTNGKLPTELLLLSDCDATLDHRKELADLLVRKRIRLDVLAIGHGSALENIRAICATTGGHVVESFDPRQWSRSMAKLSQAALAPRIVREPVTVVFENEAKSLGSETAAVWNRTWLKPQAEQWASAMRNHTEVPMAGYWRVGSGCVAAVAWELDQSRVELLAERIAQKPRDPRFSVHWENGRRVQVVVEAVDRGQFINGLTIRLVLAEDAGLGQVPLGQTGPGRYEASIAATENPRIGTLRIGDETIDRASLPGRYPAEFDALGNDHAAMRKLAEISGGEVIWPTDHGPIDFRWKKREVALTPWICAMELLGLAAGLIVWRRVQRSR